MKAIIIILATLVVLTAIRAIEVLADRRRINSVGAKANKNSRNIARYDISDKESVRNLVNDFKDLAD